MILWILLTTASAAAVAVAAWPLLRHHRPARRDTRQWDWDLERMEGRKSQKENIVYVDALRGHIGGKR